MLNKSGIYKITNVANGKCYIGSAVNIRIRWKSHRRLLKYNNHHSVLLQRAWNKYGENNFKFEILLYCNKEELIYFEQLHFDELKPEYNICKVAGSNLGFKMTDEQRAKISIIRANISDETRKKYSEAKKGKKQSPETIAKRFAGENKWLGRKHKEETKLKISEFRKGKDNHQTGRKHTPESILKISLASKNRVVSEETRRKMSEARKGIPLSYTPSKETREKMRLAKLNTKRSVESIEKQRKAQTGKKQSNETIAARTGTKRGSYKAKLIATFIPLKWDVEI